MLAAADRILEALPKPAVVALAAGGVLLVGALDLLTGYEISVSVLYLAPVGLASWYCGGRAGFAIAVLSSAAWFVADAAAGHRYSSELIPVWNALVRLGFLMVTVRLLGAIRRQLALEQQRARTDGLTGLLNGTAFVEQLERDLALARRDAAVLTLAYVDLDDFKRINDEKGHAEGDRVLRAVARALSDGLRGTDVAARIGGDEFALLLPRADAGGAQEVIARVMRSIERVPGAGGEAIACSIGVVTFLEPPADSNEALRLADELMYEVKATGKNGVAYRSVAAGAGAPRRPGTAASASKPG